ncbi:GIY-YIG nuclease family protein [Nocardia sp. NPDC060259]|uniref:GIY-YIG nuclease family protein n=1 Tax=Nocardia sp. NPDC060259 TaxID=3347088 RepID=UPI003652D0E1
MPASSTCAPTICPPTRHWPPSRGDRAWPHKIGMTTVSVAARLADQVGTALPERPVVVLELETDNAALLERAVHAVLELRGRKIETCPGNEWFETNIDEIRAVVGFCMDRQSADLSILPARMAV